MMQMQANVPQHYRLSWNARGIETKPLSTPPGGTTGIAREVWGGKIFMPSWMDETFVQSLAGMKEAIEGPEGKARICESIAGFDEV